jgi:hypothetical protein
MKRITLIAALIAAVAIAVGIFYACQKDELIQNEQPELKNFKPTDDMLVLGEKIIDPYHFEIMQKAYDIVKSKGEFLPIDKLTPTHIYMRFLPKNEDQWQILKTDTNLILYDFPLHYEIVEHGLYYHDPELPEDAITWQYSVIPVNYEYPTSIPHEILYKAYIPDLDIEDEKLRIFNENLTDEAYKLAGVTDEDGNDGEKAKMQKASKWNPSGTITVYDDVLKRQIPLQQAEVHARYGVHIERVLTNDNGYFSTSSFRYKVNYSIKWKRGKYDIRNGGLLQAWYNGPKQKSAWNLNIQKGGKSIMYATMHRAAYKAFYGDNLNIYRPTLSMRKTKLCYIDKYGTGVFWGNMGLGILPDIKIWGKNASGNYRTTEIIFGTTTHELGHQSHYQYMGNIQYWQTSKLIYESWAQAVEWALTNDEYKKLWLKYGGDAGRNYNHNVGTGGEGGQRWTKSMSNWEYSPIFIDLIDDYNQQIRENDTDFPNDNVTGYTLKDINFTILRNSYGLSSLYNTVQNNRISGVSYDAVEQLFALYW